MQVDYSLSRPGTSDGQVIKQDPEQTSPNMLHQPSIEIGTGYVVPEHAIDDSDPRPLHTPFTSMSPPSQRHSSRQSKPVERYLPDDHRSPSKATTEAARRASSGASGHILPATARSHRSSSNTSNTVHVMNGIVAFPKTTTAADGDRPESRGRESTAESELTADEKLARELQAEEHGLRRRPSMLRA